MAGAARILCLLVSSALAAPALSQPGGETGAGSGTDEEQNELILRLIERITELEARIESLEAQVEAEGGEAAALAAGEETATPGSGLAADDIDAQPGRPPADGPAGVPELDEAERREQERLVRAAFQRTLIERGGLLLPPGTVDIEPSLSYLHSSSENIVIDGFTILPVLVVDDIVSERVKRDLTQVATTARFGLPWASQLEIRVPFSYHRQRSFTADDMQVTTSGSDLGDIDIGDLPLDTWSG